MMIRVPKKIVTIGAIIFFWLAVVLAWLYSPAVLRLFGEQEKTITAFVWADIIDPESLEKFYKETGIRVRVNYYESNDELLTKLDFSEGAGFDLIMPTQTVVKIIVDKGFLKKIDKSKLDFWQNIDPHFLGAYYDPHNDYAIPYIFDVDGLGIDQTFFAGKKLEPSWALLFNPPYNYRVGMCDSHEDIIALAAKYLFGNITSLDAHQAEQVKKLLIRQKNWVEAYTDLSAEYLLTSGVCPVVYASSSYIARAIARNPRITFGIPREGAFLTIENIVIPRKSDKDELVYKFVNFLMRQDSLRALVAKYRNLPVIKKALYEMDTRYLGGIENFFQHHFANLSFVRPLMPRPELYRLWLAVKAY